MKDGAPDSAVERTVALAEAIGGKVTITKTAKLDSEDHQRLLEAAFDSQGDALTLLRSITEDTKAQAVDLVA